MEKQLTKSLNYEILKEPVNVWSELIIDSYPVVWRCIESTTKSCASLSNAKLLDFSRLTVHGRQSQFILQIVKCNDLGCCSKWKPTYSSVIP